MCLFLYPAHSGFFQRVIIKDVSSSIFYLTHACTHTYTHSAHPHTSPQQTDWANSTFSLPQDSYCLYPNEYIIGPFSVSNMVDPTRYAALPYHFQLDEHGVRAGLVEN